MHHETIRSLIAFQVGGKNLNRAARQIRNKADIRDQIEVLATLEADAATTRDLLTGTCFARTWSQVFLTNSIPRIAGSQKALNWTVAVFCRHSLAVSQHVAIREALNRHVLRGEWKEAQERIKEHTRSFGISLWALAWSLLIVEESQGSTARKELIDRFATSEKGTNLPFFAACFGLSVDKAVSDDQFRAVVLDRVPSGEPPLRRFFQLLFHEDPDPKWKTWEMLELFELLPIVDRYELLLRLAVLAIAQGHSESQQILRALCRVSQNCPDPVANYLLDCADETRSLDGNIDTRLVAAWDSYVASKYEECDELASNIALARPDILGAHELAVKASLYLNRNEALAGTTPMVLLQHHLRNVFLKNEQSEDSLKYLQRFGSRFRILSLTAPLRALHVQHSSPVPDEKWHKQAAFTYGVHGPRNFEYGFPPDQNARYLDRYAAALEQSLAARFFRDVAHGGAILERFPNVSPLRLHFFNGITAARRHDYKTALSDLATFLILQTLDRNSPLSPFAIEEARRVLVGVHLIKGHVVPMIQEVVNAYIDRAHATRRLPVEKVFAACTEDQQSACKQIEFPIIAHLACDEPHQVSLALKRFLRARGLERPSDLDVSDDVPCSVISTLFLRVCTPEVLDSLRALDTVEKVETERLVLLDWVARHVHALSRLAETEMLRLTQQAELRDAMRKLEGARVVLNISALRETEQQRFSDAFFRYSAQSELARQLRSESRTQLKLVERPGGGFVIIAPPESPKVREGQFAEFIAFAAAFREIRDAFVSSPHFGIESCLSGRIRHGFVVEHLRRPLVERKLAIRPDSPELEEERAHWSVRLGLDTKEPLLAWVMSELHILTEAVDTIAEEVKNVWIQSRTESRNPDGLFDYSFGDDQLESSFRKFSDTEEFQPFLDGVFDLLLERTRQSLVVVRSKIRHDLVEKLCRPLDETLGTVSSRDEGMHLLPLRNDLAACRSEVERSCQQMAHWFDTSDAALMGDVEFELVARTAVGMIERLNPAFAGKHRTKVHADYRLRGRHFTSLVHMLFFLLDNAIRYSGVPNERFEGSLNIQAVGNSLQISVKNLTASEVVAETAAKKIQTVVKDLKQALDPAKVIREGGSGFAKVLAAVRFEFKQNDPFVQATARDDSLTVDVRCELAGLVA